MKKLVFKKWVENVISVIGCISFMLIATTIESDWTLQYFIFLGINFVLFGGSAYLLNRYGRNEEE